MTTTAIVQEKRFCRYQGIMCEYATDMGYCKITGCAKLHELCRAYKGGEDHHTIAVDAMQYDAELRQLPSAQPEPTTEIQDILTYLDEELHPIVAPDNWNVYSELHDMISELSVEPERKNGHWVEIGDEPYDEWECDVCGFVIDGSGCIDPEEYRDVYRFCPRCGSDMRGEKE